MASTISPTGGIPGMGSAGPTYNPAQVMMNQPSSGSGGVSSQSYLKPSTVRATGSGPFDPAYRQNLATYAAGQFTPQSGNGQTNFNPTGSIPFGNPVGGGNAPGMGLPTTLLGQAMGGQPFSFAPPAAPAPSAPTPGGAGGPPTSIHQMAPQLGNLRTWLEQYMGGFQLPGATNNG